MSDSNGSPGGSGAESEGRPKRSRRRRLLGFLGRGGVNLLIAGALVAVIGLIAVRTALGNDVLVRGAVAFADQRLAGSIRVEGVRSANLLRGARLVGVELVTPDGDTLLVADSVEVDYRLRDLIRGDVVLSDLHVWGADARIVQGGTAAEPAPSTLERFLGGGSARADSVGAGEPGGEPEPESGGSSFALQLAGVRITDSRFRMTRPMDLSEESPLRTTARGEQTDLDLEVEIDRAALSSLEVLPSGRGGTTIDVDELEATVRVVDEPIRISGADAEIRVSAALIADIRELDTDIGRASGNVAVGLGGEPDIQLGLALEEVRTERLQWLSPEIPALEGSVSLSGRVREGRSEWTVANAALSSDGARLGANGGLVFQDGVDFEEFEVTLSSVPPSFFERWMPDSMRVPGAVSGRVELDGPFENFGVAGRLTVRTQVGTTTADLRGRILPAAGNTRLGDLQLSLAPVDWAMVSSFVPGMELHGGGYAELRVSGSVRDGLVFRADAHHTRVGYASSHLLIEGSARNADGWVVDVQGDASPLSLSTLRQDYPDVPMSGAVSGSFRARGPLDDLQVETDLRGDFGRANLSARLDPGDLPAGLSVSGRVEDFEAGRFLTALGDRTSLTGEIDLRGSGSDLATLEGGGRVRLGASRVNGVPIDSAVVSGRIVSSDLRIDSLRGRVGGFDLRGSGRLAVDSLRPDGELRLEFSSASIRELRPAFLGDTVIARDTLSTLEREVLTLSGVDPDTLPLAEEVAASGRVSGEVTLRGSVTDFEAEGQVNGEELVWGRSYVEEARVVFRAAGLPATGAAVDFEVEADSTLLFQRSLTRSRLEGRYAHPEGRVTAHLERGGVEAYDVESGFRLQDGGARAEVAAFQAEIDSTVYALQRPTTVVWTDSARAIRDLELLREGPEPVRIRADGSLPYSGTADFTLAVDRLQISRLLRLLQREDLDAEGLVDLDLRITGTASAPRIEGTLAADSIRFAAARFDRIAGDLSYRDRRAELSLDAERSGSRVLHAEGYVPVDLALTPGVDRFPDDAMDVQVVTDSLPARGLLGWLEDLERIEGTVTGEFGIQGTVEDPEASGRLALQNGAWTLGSVGVRQDSVNGTVEIRPSGAMALEATARAGGSARATGEIRLTTLTDPEFDLEINLDGFQAVDRLDVAGSVSGDLTLTGRFRQPVLRGDLEVDEGSLYLDEFQRNVGVLDLSDPRYSSIIDTTDIGGRQILSRTQNPFMDGLTVDILMDVEQNTWLRGQDLQVEIAGQDIGVFYDRPRQDLVLLGDLNVVRGQYFLQTRAFEVEGGTVSFQGTPGINPNMQISASTRIRRQDDDPLDIDVEIDGTLLDPRITVSSDEQGLSESDMYSYIYLGQPASSLTGTTGGTPGAQTAAFGFAGSWLSGTVANQLAAIASQRFSLIDYLAITQVGDLGIGQSTGLADSFSSTQVEIGRYFSNGEIFGALVLRPLSRLGASTNVVGGARMEWQSSDAYHLEAFVEDQFLRSSGIGLSELGGDANYIFGFAFVREWGY